MAMVTTGVLEQQATSFAERGFITVPDALSSQQVRLMRDAIEAHRRDRPVSRRLSYTLLHAVGQ